MARPLLLEEFYEKDHRARFIEEGQVLPLLCPRAHDGSIVMHYNARYTPRLARAQLAGVANVVARRMPPFNGPALTTLVDRWRPETHSFHLPCGEMTVTLQDVAMMLALPIRGEPVTGRCDSAGWRARVAEFLGEEPPLPEAGKRGRSAGVPLSWLRAWFGTCPADADEATVTYHARAWVMHMFGTVLFPDGTRDSASWMYLPCLMEWDAAGQFSWGSAVLAFLYRQLCEACRCRKPRSSLGGCVFLLQLWMWSRLPVGRPRVRAPQPWTPEGVPEQLPTAAYLWEHVGAPYAETERAYVEFSNELDALTPSCVNWWPYCDDDVAAVENGLGLNPLCHRDSALWTMRCPLICFYAVEYHLPIRVMRQFGRQQPFPPDIVSTSIELHKFDRSKQKKAWTDRDYSDMESSDDENTPYDIATRQGTVVEIGPVLDRVGRDIWRSVNDISNAMAFPAGQPDGESRLRAAMEVNSPLLISMCMSSLFLHRLVVSFSLSVQRLQWRLRRVATRCGCRAQTMHDVAPPVLSPERSRASGGSRSRASGGSRSRASGGSRSRGRASTSRGASSSHTRSRARASSSDASDAEDED
ncbi:hypothetical protein EJB05_27860, partial [Eragrostis curvula]